MEKLYTITPADLLQGFAPDVPKNPPVLDIGENMVFTGNSARTAAGQYVVLGAEEIAEWVTGLLATRIGGAPYTFIGTPTRLLLWDGTDLSVVGEDYNGTPFTPWCIGRWGDWVYATNGVDAPQIYKGTSFEALTGLTFSTARIMVTHPSNAFVLAFGTAGGDEGAEGMMHWCERDDLETWETAADNFAGSLPLRNLRSEVRTAIAVGSVVVFATADELYYAQFIGSPFAFGYDKIADGVGVVGLNAIATAEGGVYGFSNRGMWAADLGGGFRYFDAPFLREHVLSRLDGGKQGNVVLWDNRAENMVVMFIPEREIGTGVPTYGVGFNYLDKNWSLLGYGRTVVSDNGIYPYALAADADGNIYYQAAVGQAPGFAPLPGATAPGAIPVSDAQAYSGGFGFGPFGAWRFG